MKNCPKCNKQLNDGSDYCENCKMQAQPEQTSSQQTINDSSTVKQKKTKTAFICAAIAAVAVTAGALCFVLFANNGGESEVSSASSVAGGEDSAVSDIRPTTDLRVDDGDTPLTDADLSDYLYEKDNPVGLPL